MSEDITGLIFITTLPALWREITSEGYVKPIFVFLYAVNRDVKAKQTMESILMS